MTRDIVAIWRCLQGSAENFPRPLSVVIASDSLTARYLLRQASLALRQKSATGFSDDVRLIDLAESFTSVIDPKIEVISKSNSGTFRCFPLYSNPLCPICQFFDSIHLVLVRCPFFFSYLFGVLGVQSSVAELFLLSIVDQLVLSPYSTYGYVAGALQGRPPYFVTRDNICMRTFSSEPCPQYWYTMYYTSWFDLKSHESGDAMNFQRCLL